MLAVSAPAVRLLSTAVPGRAANMFHAACCWAANARLIRFSAAKSPNSCRTCAAAALLAACSACSGVRAGPARALCGCCRRRLLDSGAFISSVSSLQQEDDIALHAGARGLARIDAHGRSSCSSLTRRSLRKPWLSAQQHVSKLFNTRDCKAGEHKTPKHCSCIEVRQDAVERYVAKRVVRGARSCSSHRLQPWSC